MLCGEGRPSAETALHLAVVRARRAGAVLHTHSVWSTILSEAFAAEGRLGIQGYEMLKGLEGVGTHEQREWVPIVENSQDIRKLAHRVSQALEKWPHAHGILLRRHGLYTWGTDLFQARRHLEVLEFLLEVVGRKYCAPKSGRISRPAV
jgi:methylthioribulose-1-phosphate dehydratase